jgi:hypothetical protein
MGPALIRLSLLVIALLAGLWLGLGVRAIDLESEAKTSASKPGGVGRALSALHDARLLSADKEPLLNEALLRFATGRHARGIAIGERLVAAEPDNLDTWMALYYMHSTSHDARRAARVARRVRAINPLVAERLKDARP